MDPDAGWDKSDLSSLAFYLICPREVVVWVTGIGKGLKCQRNEKSSELPVVTGGGRFHLWFDNPVTSF
jgi:hypothetical protein